MFQNSIERDEALNPIWQEAEGRCLIAVNSVELPGLHTKASSFKGIWNEWVSVGDGYYRWDGPNLDWNPGAGILPFRLHIERPDTYTIALRMLVPAAQSGSCFIRIDGGQWWIVPALKSATWTWANQRAVALDRLEPFRIQLDRGFHQVEICGRANGVRIDRLALGADGVNYADPQIPNSSKRLR